MYGKRRSLILGLTLLLAHNVLTGWQDVYRAIAFRKLDVFSLTFIAFSIVIVVFGVVFRKSGKISKLKSGEMMILNCWTTGSWGSMFLAIWLIHPALAAAIATSLSPVCTYFINRKIRPAAPSSLGDGVVCFSAIGITACLAWITSSVEIVSGSMSHAVWGISLAIFAAFSDAMMTVSMKSGYDRGVTESELLARRFYLLAALAFTFAIARSKFIFSLDELISGVYLALFGVIPATLLLQKGLKYVEPVLFEIILATVPAFVLIFQFSEASLMPTPMAVIGIFLVVGLSIVQTYRSFGERKNA